MFRTNRENEGVSTSKIVTYIKTIALGLPYIIFSLVEINESKIIFLWGMFSGGNSLL